MSKGIKKDLVSYMKVRKRNKYKSPIQDPSAHDDLINRIRSTRERIQQDAQRKLAPFMALFDKIEKKDTPSLSIEVKTGRTTSNEFIVNGDGSIEYKGPMVSVGNSNPNHDEHSRFTTLGDAIKKVDNMPATNPGIFAHYGKEVKNVFDVVNKRDRDNILDNNSKGIKEHGLSLTPIKLSIEEVKKLKSLQRTLGSDKLKEKLNEVDNIEDEHDRPRIIEHDGERYIRSGNHRLAARLLIGAGADVLIQGNNSEVTRNVFCATGIGGGVDATCSPNSQSSGGILSSIQKAYGSAKKVVQSFKDKVDKVTDIPVLRQIKAVGNFTKGLTSKYYSFLEGRYGKTQAIGIMASGQMIGWGAMAGPAVGLPPVWLPMVSIWGSLPAAAMAETLLRTKRGVGKLLKSKGEATTNEEELTDEQMEFISRNLAKKLMADYTDYLKSHSEDMRKVNNRYYGYDINDSSAIEHLGYERSNHDLDITFVGGNGEEYTYPDIDMYQLAELLAAPSKGSYYNREIRLNAVNQSIPTTNKENEFYRPENYDKVRDLPNGRELWSGANDWESGTTWAGIHDKSIDSEGYKNDPIKWTSIDHTNCPGCKGTLDAHNRQSRRLCLDYGHRKVEEWLDNLVDNEHEGKGRKKIDNGGYVLENVMELIGNFNPNHDEEGKFTSGLSTDIGRRMSAFIKDHLKSQEHLTDEHRGHYAKSMDHVLSRMNEKCINTLNQMVDKIDWHSDTYKLTRELAKTNPQMEGIIEKGGIVAGAYNMSTKTLTLDGKSPSKTSSTIGTYAHEISHTLDGTPGNRHSSSPEWKEAYEKEIKGEKITKYADTNHREGWAEFGRLVLSGNLHHGEIKERFPKCWKIWKDKGYVNG